MVVRFCPRTQMAYAILNKGMHVVMGKGKERKVHGLPFVLGIQAMILPHHEVF